jgi:hypothetical protein
MPITLNGTTGIIGPDGSASTPAIQGSDTNTGMFFPAADTIAFSEGGVEVGRFDSSANFQFNSGYGSVATAYACRAWVNFNGQGTVAIRASANVSSITDNGVGNYTMNFTNAMPDINYVGLTGGSYNRFVSTTNSDNSATRTVSATYVGTNDSGAAADLALVQVAILR